MKNNTDIYSCSIHFMSIHNIHDMTSFLKGSHWDILWQYLFSIQVLAIWPLFISSYIRQLVLPFPAINQMSQVVFVVVFTSKCSVCSNVLCTQGISGHCYAMSTSAYWYQPGGFRPGSRLDWHRHLYRTVTGKKNIYLGYIYYTYTLYRWVSAKKTLL